MSDQQHPYRTQAAIVNNIVSQDHVVLLSAGRNIRDLLGDILELQRIVDAGELDTSSRAELSEQIRRLDEFRYDCEMMSDSVVARYSGMSQAAVTAVAAVAASIGAKIIPVLAVVCVSMPILIGFSILSGRAKRISYVVAAIGNVVEDMRAAIDKPQSLSMSIAGTTETTSVYISPSPGTSTGVRVPKVVSDNNQLPTAEHDAMEWKAPPESRYKK